jgi:nucleoid-associated protein YgaU
MGILDFANEGDSKELVEAVKKAIAAKVKISNLSVEAEDGVVTLRGEADSDDAKTKAIAAAKAAPGVKKIRDGIKIAEALIEGAKKTASGEVVYTVKSGDTLWGLSEKFYGDGSKYMEIFEANKEVWKDYKYDPNVIYVGWKLTIPEK